VKYWNCLYINVALLKLGELSFCMDHTFDILYVDLLGGATQAITQLLYVIYASLQP